MLSFIKKWYYCLIGQTEYSTKHIPFEVKQLSENTYTLVRPDHNTKKVKTIIHTIPNEFFPTD